MNQEINSYTKIQDKTNWKRKVLQILRGTSPQNKHFQFLQSLSFKTPGLRWPQKTANSKNYFLCVKDHSGILLLTVMLTWMLNILYLTVVKRQRHENTFLSSSYSFPLSCILKSSVLKFDTCILTTDINISHSNKGSNLKYSRGDRTSPLVLQSIHYISHSTVTSRLPAQFCITH